MTNAYSDREFKLRRNNKHITNYALANVEWTMLAKTSGRCDMNTSYRTKNLHLMYV